MINTRILLKALSVMFLPTLSILAVMLFLFLDWHKFITFITGDSGWAILLRFVLVILEAIAVVFMYKYYNEQHIKALAEEWMQKAKESALNDPILGTEVASVESHRIRNYEFKHTLNQIPGVDGATVQKASFYVKDAKAGIYIMKLEK